MSKEIDRRLRHAGNRTSRDAARLIFKVGERKQDKLAKLQGEIDELRATIKDNRGDLTYAEALQRLQELEDELKGERSGEND